MKKGWKTKRVGEIAQHSLGKMLDKAKNRGEPKPYLRNLNVRWGEFDLSDLLEMRFLPDEAEKYTAVKGDVLVCEGGYPGRAAIWDRDEPVYFQKALHRVRFHEPERNRWFVHYLQFRDLEGTLRKHFNGAGIQHFTGEALAQFEIPVPPLAEQQRIVGVLDEAFAGLATAQAHAAQNLQNARALFESHLQSVFTHRGKGWVEKWLSELCDIKHGYAFEGAEFSNTVSRERPIIITPGNFTEEATLSFTDKKTKRFSGTVPEDFRFSVGDLVVVMTDLSSKMKILGKPAFVESLNILHNQRIGRFVFLTDEVEKRFVYFFLRTEAYLKQIRLSATGTMVKHTAPKRILSAVLPFPPNRAEQQKVVTQLDALATETQRLVHFYTQKQAALTALKKSLLHQAFTGAL